MIKHILILSIVMNQLCAMDNTAQKTTKETRSKKNKSSKAGQIQNDSAQLNAQEAQSSDLVEKKVKHRRCMMPSVFLCCKKNDAK